LVTEAVLLTGGAGYIGSHTYLALVEAGYEPVILDDFSNAHRSVIDRLAAIVGRPVPQVELNVLDVEGVTRALTEHRINAVVHFAAKKAVGESVEKPLDYLENNICGLVALLRAMANANVFHLVFSSSAAVYGEPDRLPIEETAECRPSSPYGFTKMAGEQLLEHLRRVDPRWRVGVLRYFNPVGAHASGKIGEDPASRPANLVPYMAKVAIGELPEVVVFGDDYDTPDGTGVRDYIHVSDIAEGHVLSLDALLDSGTSHLVNLGTGGGHSVLEVIEAYSAVCGHALPFRIAARRPGDVAACYADVTRASEVLGFRAKRDLAEMCRSSWAWIQNRSRTAP
jgi:UDP-glucose 4-epimerase